MTLVAAASMLSAAIALELSFAALASVAGDAMRQNGCISSEPLAMRLFNITTAMLITVAAAPPLHAQSVTLAGRNVQLTVPRGYCVANETGAEGQVVSGIRYGIGPGNKLLLVFARCEELKAMRSARAGAAENGFDDYGTFAVLAPNGEIKLFDRYDRQWLIKGIVEGAGHGQIVADALKRAQDRLQERDFKKLESLGVLDADANAVYIGIVGTLPNETGKLTDRVLSVGGSTLVKGMNVSIALYKRLERPSDLAQMLTRQKENLAAFVASNK